MSKYSLVGVDSNAFNVMGYVANALRREGLRDLKNEYYSKAQSSDYDNLIVVSMEYLDKANEKAVENGYEDDDYEED